MNIDETTLIEIQDYIDALDEKVGLKPETILDLKNAIIRHKTELKNSRLSVLLCEEHPGFPHPKCDKSCYFYCTKGGEQPPSCVKKSK